MYNVNVQFALVEVRVCASGTQELPQNLVLGGSALSPQLSLSGADIIANIALKLGFHFQAKVDFLQAPSFGESVAAYVTQETVTICSFQLSINHFNALFKSNF